MSGAEPATAPSPALPPEVVTASGWRHVGWYCEHEPNRDGTNINPHVAPSRKNKRGWTSEVFVTRSLIFHDDDRILCPSATPLFVREERQS